MADYTTNYNLKKPLLTEKYSVEDQNGNMDILDSEIRRLDAGMGDLVKVKTNISILAANWVDDTLVSGFWYYDITDSDIIGLTIADVNIKISYLESAKTLKSVTESFDGYVRIYSSKQIKNNIIADIKLIKQVGVE